MRKLDINYTSQEQTEILIALGVPKNSADCIRVKRTGLVFFMQEDKTADYYIEHYKTEIGEEAEPSWSLGRLIEIFAICYTGDYFNTNLSTNCYCIEDTVHMIKVQYNLGYIDFSKLDEENEKITE